MSEIKIGLACQDNQSEKDYKDILEGIFKDLERNKKVKGKITPVFASADAGDVQLIVGGPEALSNAEERIKKKVMRPVPSIILLHTNEWGEDVNRVLQSPCFDARGIFRLPRVKMWEGRDAEDFAALSSVVKDLARRILRLEERLREEDISLSKAVDWKAKSEHASGFISLFSDPSMQSMARLYKDALLDLDNEALRVFRGKSMKSLQDKIAEPPEEGLLSTCGQHLNKAFKDFDGTGFRIPSLLLLGETGCGKTLLAQAAARALTEGSFFKANISAYPPNAIDGFLFGWKKGSFTDSEEDSPGVFIAHCGQTVFLDEIGDMDAESQTRLLTYMDDGRVTPQGMTKAILAPCILIAATNKDVDNPASGFRQDIVHRFDHVIRIPPLRERKQDLRLLISLTLQDDKINPPKKIKMESGSPNAKDIQPEDRRVSRISLDAIEYLEGYDFPGNFRQLEFILRQAVNQAFAEGADCLCLRHVKDKR